MTDLEWKAATPIGSSGEFHARIYRVDSEPDGDGDVIARGAITDGHDVQVSFAEHDTMFTDAEPVGTAKLFHVGNAVHAVGSIHDSADGRRFKQSLAKNGPHAQWSIGWPNATLKFRKPTAAEAPALAGREAIHREMGPT